MAWIYEDDDAREFFTELKGLPDRAVGLLAATILDVRLESAIKVNLHDSANKKLFRMLFDYSGVAASFGNRINLGFAIGLYTEGTMNDLHVIRRIRNEFANKQVLKDFDVQSMRTLISTLRIAEKYEININDKASTSGYESCSFALASSVIRKSSVESVISPRNRFIRSVEMIAAFLFLEGHLSESVRRSPKF
jgi:hypothetical protein